MLPEGRDGGPYGGSPSKKAPCTPGKLAQDSPQGGAGGLFDLPGVRLMEHLLLGVLGWDSRESGEHCESCAWVGEDCMGLACRERTAQHVRGGCDLG